MAKIKKCLYAANNSQYIWWQVVFIKEFQKIGATTEKALSVVSKLAGS